MVKCEECGKTLGFLEGYQHPTMGKKYYLCSPCFDGVSESIALWEEFVRANSFELKPLKNNIKLDWKKILPNIRNIGKTLEADLIEKEINVKR
ncbi:hypothetical protein AYK24_06895 [Thermoplasmatales archaeon SG8-52-4]|nr:MAG: hypothetical protein AYK24_06895 [Thermoplasmatales archaeon SG8-52-4]